MSSTERDVDDELDEQSRKKSRGDTPQTLAPSLTEATASEDAGSAPQNDSKGVQEVTQGVKEVELQEKEKRQDGATAVVEEDDLKGDNVEVAPESVPLPKEVSGELDEGSSIASTPPAEATEEVDELSESEEKTEEPSEASTGVEQAIEGEETEACADPVAKPLTEKSHVSV